MTKIIDSKNELNENGTHTVAIVGAGIVGVCCALALQKQGYEVTLIDKTGVAQGCSKGNAGHFATEQVFPLAEAALLPQLPKMLLREDGPISINLRYLPKATPWFLRFIGNMAPKKFARSTQALKSLNENAIPAYDRLLQEHGLSQFLIKEGSLLTFETTSDHTIRAMQQRFSQQGVNVKWLNEAQTKQLEPSLAASVKASLFFPDVAHTPDPEQLCIALFEKFTAQGGCFLKETVLGLQPLSGKKAASTAQSGIRVQTQSMGFRFDNVLVTAGAWSKQLLTPLGYKVPLDTERGYHMMVDKHPPMTRPVASHERKMILTPMSHGLRMAGTVEFAGLHAKSNTKRACMVAKHGEKLLKGLQLPEGSLVNPNPDKIWMGMRPSFPDSLPAIGKAPHHSNLYLAFGHQHLGLTQAAITAELIAAEMAKADLEKTDMAKADLEKKPGQQHQHTQPAVDLAPFCISRFG